MLPPAARRATTARYAAPLHPPPSPPQEISRAYGPDACKLLPINSRVAGAPPLPDLWTGARPPEFNPTADAPPPPNEQLGALLSDADMEQARTPTPTPTPAPAPAPAPTPTPTPAPAPALAPTLALALAPTLAPTPACTVVAPCGRRTAAAAHQLPQVGGHPAEARLCHDLGLYLARRSAGGALHRL